MWLISSLIVCFVYLLLFGGMGFALARLAQRVFRGALTRLMSARTWVALTLVMILVLVILEPLVVRSWLRSILGSEFLAWWTLACFCGGFGFSVPWLASQEKVRKPEVVDAARLVADQQLDGRWLHVYGQESWHDPAYIVGSADALEELRRAVQAALSAPAGVGVTQTVFTSDKEGYRAIVVRVQNGTFFQQSDLPYTADHAGGSTPEGRVRMLMPAELSEAVAAACQEADALDG